MGVSEKYRNGRWAESNVDGNRVGHAFNGEYNAENSDRIPGITYPHRAVHDKILWLVNTVETDHDIASPTTLLFVPGPTGQIHFNFRCEGSAGGRVQLFKGPTVTANGTSVAPFNLNQDGEIYYNKLNAVAGGGFSNQPNDDGVEIVSDSTSDIGSEVVIYGVRDGALGDVVEETLSLNGTTAVSSAITDWSVILGVEKVTTVGTVTVREASGDATITTLVDSATSAGIVEITGDNQKAYGNKMRIVASGASTALVGVLAKNTIAEDYNATSALSGTTEKEFSSVLVDSVSKVLVGAVADTVDVTLRAAQVYVYSGATTSADGEIKNDFVIPGSSGLFGISFGGGTKTEAELILEPETPYLLRFTTFADNATSGMVADWYGVGA